MIKSLLIVSVAAVGMAFSAQGALAQSADVDVDVSVVLVNPEPAGREVCNSHTCWIESGRAPRSREVFESTDHWERRTIERN